MPPGTSRLDVIIVNWNAGPVVCECVESLAAARAPGIELDRVVLIDNASDEWPVPLRDFGLPLQVVRNERNRGFAAACNQGAFGSRADYLLFLNPDVVLGPNALAAPIAVLERDADRRIGIAGIQLVDRHGSIRRTSARRPTRKRFLAALLRLDRLWPAGRTSYRMVEWDHGDTRTVDHVTGAFYLVRRSLYERLAGFDERFFVYFEDLDFSMRAQDAGWSAVYVAEAQASHRGGWASGRFRRIRLYHDWRSRVAFARKQFGGGTAAAAFALTAVVDPAVRIGAGVRQRSGTEVRESVSACLDRLFGRDPGSGRPARRRPIV
jgi:GT2 family glycosyltransferase